MDIVTLAAVGVLVVERILVHTITAIKRCKSRCACSSCDVSKDHDNQETTSPSREWRYPRTYRTIFAEEPRGIFQADVMELYPLWNKIFDEYERNTLYRPKDYALVCIDVFSRYV
jgi:hypothetical protein